MGLGSFLGGLFGSGIDTAAAQVAAKQNRDFQERMFKNRYQYTVEDMSKAGINPILSAKLGGGNAPPGAAAAPGNITKNFLDYQMQSIRRKTAGSTAKAAAAEARIKEYAAILSDRDRALGTSAYGISAARARLAPEGIVQRSLFGADQLWQAGKEWLDGSGKGVKKPVHRRPTIRINKWEKGKP